MAPITLKFREDGAVSSLQYDGVEFIAAPKPLFVFQMRDRAVGRWTRLDSSIFPKVEIVEEGNRTTLNFKDEKFWFRSSGGASATVTLERCGDELRWGISLDIREELVDVEWIDFPIMNLKVPQDFRYLSTYAEGALLPPDGLGILKRLISPEEGSTGYIGYAPMMLRYFYPGTANAQFHAILREGKGLYIGFEDRNDSLKLMEVSPEDDGTCTLLQQQFTGGRQSLDYQVVMRGFQGGWEQAAAIQRQWLEAGPMPSKIRGAMPDWYDRDPLMVIYPVKGDGLDHFTMTVNKTYFPYIKGMEVVKKYHELLPGVPLMPLLMHWEGTAPWAPPFVWPPHGGEALLKEFTDALHAQGDYIGLYASGIGWTQISAIDHSYDCRKRFEDEHVDKEICVGPVGERYAVSCNHPLAGQRVGYDLCPSREYTKNVVKNEVAACQAHGIDYLQYFDQNCGGAISPCYSKEHGHPHLPGPWLAKAMRETMEVAQKAGKDTLAIGCENTAAFPYMAACRVNDVRYINAWMNGEPVPLYSYLFHEYSLGFSGNTCGIEWFCEYKKQPYFLNLHFAWHFVYGNMLALVTNRERNIHWGWACDWNAQAPNQEMILTLMRNLLKWRHGIAKEFLLYGRLETFPEVKCATVGFKRKEFVVEAEKPAVLAATWSYEGKRITILVNYTTDPQPVEVHFAENLENAVRLGNDGPERPISGQALKDVVPPLDAIVIVGK